MALVRLPCVSLQILGHKSNQKNPNPKVSLSNYSLAWSSSSASLCRSSVQAKSRNLTSYFSATTQEPILESSSSSPADSISAATEEIVEEISKTRLIAQNVPWAATPEDIRTLFEKYGSVVDIEMSMHKKERNRGLVFIEMGSPEEAATALKSLESYEYEGRRLKVDYAKAKKKKTYAPREKPSEVPTFNLFVANLAFEARAKHLKEFFDADTGNVVSTEVIFHENPRRSSGYGFVSFKTKKQAEAAIIEFQGKDFMGRPIRLARSKQFVKLQAKEGLQPPEEEEEPSSQSESVTAEDETPAAEN
ncbi:PREDICTED: RNA-binding protein CP33, chloroplastic-like [Camelina sativa]|uniref:RNA-binding protein CP33, chloroplastic-like n=1 Tax=Camelina sativa TaxID=90675 RepID=A0ABM1QSV3_CAMSA|nr:PREDICTED: RNA-binding protein CP33, chloroplastic-like [Camelina sativa]XP_019089841.1 PREDICTED: RNA-binding protein CP33, chloroplastic-like [Camelina sativa]